MAFPTNPSNRELYLSPYTNTLYRYNIFDDKWSRKEVNGSLPWTPNDIITVAWYDASDSGTITESGGAVSSWADKSGNGYDLTQGSGSLQPTTGTRTIGDGLNVIDFDGSEALEALSLPIGTSGDVAVFMVAEIDVVDNSNDSLFAMNSATYDFQLSANDASQFYGRVQTAAASNLSLSGGPFAGPSIFNLNFKRSDSSTLNAYIDGVSKGSNNSYLFALDATQDLKCMENRGGSNKLDGCCGEFIVMNDITDETRQKIEGYLAWKWGLTTNLPESHPYKNAAP